LQNCIAFNYSITQFANASGEDLSPNVQNRAAPLTEVTKKSGDYIGLEYLKK